MITGTYRWLEVFVHLIFWVGLWLLVKQPEESRLIVEQVGQQDKIIKTQSLQLLTYTISAAIFYGNLLFLYPRYLRTNRVLYVVLLVLWAVILSFAEGAYLKSLSIVPASQTYSEAVVNHTVFLLFSVVYVLVKNNQRVEKEITIRRENQLINELSFLKSQLNPHFLFNSINNIFSIAQKNGDDEVAQYIAGLSKIMRYSLYESNEFHVPLEKELKFIESYIEMSRLKFSEEDLKFSQHRQGITKGKKIAPLLIVPLVENAFKHLPISDQKNYISFDVNIEALKLNVQVSNSHSENHKIAKDAEGGIGLNNLKRRLELLYPNRHLLEVKQESDSFHVKMEVPLNE